MLELHPDSLLWVAIFGLVDNLATVLFGAWIGSFLDRYGGTDHACIPIGIGMGMILAHSVTC